MDQRSDTVPGALGKRPKLAALLDSDLEDGRESPRLVALLDSVTDGNRGVIVGPERDPFEAEDPEDDEEVRPLRAGPLSSCRSTP